MEKIIEFKDKYSFLSNFHPINIIINNQLWQTSEHMFMACKTTDSDKQEQIRLAPTPGKAKRLGRKLTLRPNWEQLKDNYMLTVLRIKFNQNKKMTALLLDTNSIELIEGNHWHDNYWGSCLCKRCNNKGQNKLGLLLMQVREEIKNKTEPFLTKDNFWE